MGKFLFLFFSCILVLSACKEDSVSQGKENGNSIGLIKVTENDYTSDVAGYLFTDEEPEEVLFNEAERSFRVNVPLQVSINEKQELFVRFYSPRAIQNLIVWAKIAGYDEEFQLAQFDVLPPFVEFHQLLPFAEADKEYHTVSGKQIWIMANPRISAADLTLRIECSDVYYQKLVSVKPQWNIWFSDYGKTGSWEWPLLPAHARECVAISLNMAYMFSSEEFKAELEKYRGKLHSDANRTLVDVDKLYNNIISHSGLRWGHVTGVGGLGGGNTIGIHDGSYLQHYPDDQYEVMALFHEYAHCLGYGHDGNMTNENTGDGFRILTRDLYKQMCIDKRLPVYSRRFMHNRKYGKFYDVARYMASTVVIEGSELDAIDGGLGVKPQEDDENLENGTALSFVITHKDVPGSTVATFTPKDIAVYNKRIYLINNAAGRYSLEVFDENNGKLVHYRTVREWKYNEITETFSGEPNGVTVAHGKVYVTNTGSRTDVFDANTLEFITCIGNGNWGEGSAQTVHAFDVLVKNGFVFIRDKRKVCVFMESDVTAGNYKKVPNYCRFSNVGEAMGTYGLALDKEGVLYTTHQGNKQIYAYKINDMREQQSLEPFKTLTLSAAVHDVVIIGDRMLVTLGQSSSLVEISPKTGDVIKDYTTVAGYAFVKPEKIAFYRQTLFVVDRDTKSVTAIPVKELK